MASEAMKIDNVRRYYEKLGIDVKNNVIYAQMDAKVSDYLIFRSFVFLAIQHFLLCFEEDRIVVTGLTTMADFANENIAITRDRIKSIRYKKGIIQSKLIIEVENETYKFLVPKMIVVAPWQKENLAALLEKDFK